MSLRFLIDAFSVVPRSVLARDLEFRKLSILEGVESVVMATLTVGTAWLTRSYWSFVVGNLVSGLVFTLAAVTTTRLGPSLPRALSEIRLQMAFGYNVVVSAWRGTRT
jgi:O-antigen/teichoic acid export membrane protein